MRCLKCGTVISDGGSVCPHCGADMSVKDTEGVSEAVQEETAQESSSGGIDLSSIPGQTSTVGFKKKDDKEKLFESLGKVVLYSAILSAVFNFKTAYEFLSGIDYRRLGSSPEEIYSKFGPALKYLDKSMGIMLVFLGCLCIWGAIAIKKKKKYTPSFWTKPAMLWRSMWTVRQTGRSWGISTLDWFRPLPEISMLHL